MREQELLHSGTANKRQHETKCQPVDEAIAAAGGLGPTDAQTHNIFNADLQAGIS